MYENGVFVFGGDLQILRVRKWQWLWLFCVCVCGSSLVLVLYVIVCTKYLIPYTKRKPKNRMNENGVFVFGGDLQISRVRKWQWQWLWLFCVCVCGSSLVLVLYVIVCTKYLIPYTKRKPKNRMNENDEIVGIKYQCTNLPKMGITFMGKIESTSNLLRLS